MEVNTNKVVIKILHGSVVTQTVLGGQTIYRLVQCFSTVSKVSTGPPMLSKKIKLRPTFAATRCIFWALSRSKMYLRSGHTVLPSSPSWRERALYPVAKNPPEKT